MKAKKKHPDLLPWEPLSEEKATAVRFLTDKAFGRAAFIAARRIDSFEMYFPGFNTVILSRDHLIIFAALKDDYVLEELATQKETSAEDLREMRRSLFF